MSTDPAMGEYVPAAGKENNNLPNGGVYNYTNLHTFHYSNNNPIKYKDPDGRRVKNKENKFNNNKDIYVKYENEIKGEQGEMLKPGEEYPKGKGNEKADGVIVYDDETGNVTIYKINDRKDSPVTVNFSVLRRKNGKYLFFLKPFSFLFNIIGNVIKDKDKDKAGRYNLDDLPEDHDLRKWYNEGVDKHDEMKNWEADRQQKRADKQQNINQEELQ